MAITLKVTPEVLESKSWEVYRDIQNVEKSFQEIERTIQNSRHYWEGEASNAHQKLFSSYKSEIEEIIRRLKEHPIDLQKMAGIYNEATRAAMEVTQPLRGDVIV